MKLYLNTIQREWYDETGSPFSDSYPQIPFGNVESVTVQCCTDTPNAGTEGVDPATDWTKDTQFTGMSALMTVDNNFKRHLKATVATAAAQGATNLVLAISGITIYDIPATGKVRLFSADGTYEQLDYTNREKSGNNYTFELAGGLSKGYAVGADADCSEAMYAEAYYTAATSDPANGKFVFDITMNSPKLRNAADYSDSQSVDDVKGFEIIFYTVSGGTVTMHNAYLCNTFSIPLTMGEPLANP